MVKSFRPENLEEALKIREDNDVIIYAGGTDLMVRRKRWSGTLPYFEKDLLFIAQLPELTAIKKEINGVVIGACASLTQINETSFVPEVLRLAILEMASPAIRNSGTLGGNICNASPAGDTLTALYALDAILIIQSLKSQRKIPISEFIKGPGKIELDKNEILTGVYIPNNETNQTYYKKVGTRKADALSKASFVCLKLIKDGLIKDIRLSFGAVFATVVRDKELENKLKNKNQEWILNNINEILSWFELIIKPIDDQRSTAVYRKKVVLRLLKDALID